MIYLDHAAATPVDPEVLRAMLPYFSEQFYNPSATYLPAKHVRQSLEQARADVAQVLGAKPSEIIFTAGGTEANNIAIQGVLAANPNCSVTISAVEHDSVRFVAEKYNCSVAFVTEQGIVRLDDLRAKISDKTVLVSIMYANNEVGALQPIKEITNLVRQIRRERAARGIKTPLYIHTDACQAANYADLQVARLGVDMMTLNGGKIYGPKQSGALYIASHVRIDARMYGGGQERGLRSGTENVAFAVGFAAALVQAQQQRKTEAHRLSQLQKYAFRQMSEKIPGATVNGSIQHRLPNNLHITLPGTDNERVLLELEQVGILAAAGSACSASSQEPSHVLAAMGITESDIRGSLRFSMGRSTTQADIDALIAELAKNRVMSQE